MTTCAADVPLAPELASEPNTNAPSVDSTKIAFHDFYKPSADQDVLYKARAFHAFLRDAKARGHYSYRRTLLEASQARPLVLDAATARPRKMILMASNNYLDLANDPTVVAAAQAALTRYGYGSGSVALLAGTQHIHRQLEQRIADFYGREAAAVFPTGYSANVGTLSALLREGDIAIVDMYAHASLLDGTRLSSCLTKFFKHNDMTHLRALLQRVRPDFNGALVVTDGVFSMDGDICRLRELVDLCREYNARLLIDEAHGVGVLGAHGKGTEEHTGALGATDIITGTLSKAPSGLGGYVVGKAEMVEYVRHFAGSYVFSTSLPASVVGGLLAAFDIMEHDDARRRKLTDNAAYFVHRLRAAGFDVGDTETPIVPVIIRDELVTRQIALALDAAGIFASPVTFPAVAKTRSRIRFSVMSSHTREDLDNVVEALQELGTRYGILAPTTATAAGIVAEPAFSQTLEHRDTADSPLAPAPTRGRAPSARGVVRPRVAVTGANGFLGSHIVRELGRSGFEVVALVRRGSSTAALAHTGARLALLDYDDEDALREALRGCEALVHNAARASDWGPRTAFDAANVTLVRRVLETARAVGLRRIVHISSTAVLGEEDCTRAKSEDAPPRPRLPYASERLWPSAMNSYRESKADGESVATAFAREHNLDLTVLRPTWIFGPREFHAGPYEYCKSAASGVPAFPGSRSNLFHVVYVRDVARAVAHVLHKRPAGVRLYTIGTPTPPRMHDYFALYTKYMGIKQPSPIARGWLAPIAVLLEAVWQLLRLATPPTLTRARLYMCYANNVYATDKIERELGFVADSDLERAVRTTVRWWQLYGFLPRRRAAKDAR